MIRLSLWHRLALSSVTRMADDGGAAGGAPGGGDGGAPPATPPGGSGAPPPGSPPPPWWSGVKLSDEVKAFVEGKAFPDLPTALESAMNADKVARARNLLDRPDPAKLGEWKHWQDLGWVEDETKYTLKAPETIAEAIRADAGLTEAVRKAAHTARIPVPQAQAVYEHLLGFMDGRLREIEGAGAKAQQDMDTELRQAWGGEFDKNVEFAKRAFGKLVGDAGISADLEAITGHAGLMKLFHTIGKAMGEDAFVGGEARGTAMNPADARTERKKLEASAEFRAAMNDPRHPRYAELKAQRQRLLDIEAPRG